jgi:hypothetical protein
MRPDKIRQECMSDQLFCFLAAIYFQQTSCQELLPGPRLTHRCSCYSLQIDTKLSQAWHENVFIVAMHHTCSSPYLDQSWQWGQSPWNHNSSGSFPYVGSTDSWLLMHGLWDYPEKSKGNPFVESGNPRESMRNWYSLVKLLDPTIAWTQTKFSAILLSKQISWN